MYYLVIYVHQANETYLKHLARDFYFLWVAEGPPVGLLPNEWINSV